MEQNQTASSMPLAAYVLLAWKGRRTIVGAALLCGALALLASLVTPRSYDAQLTVLVSPPTFKEEITPNSGVTGYNPRSLAMLMPARFSVETYQALAKSPSFLDEVRKSVNMDAKVLSTLVKRCDVRLIQLGSRTPQFGTSYADAMVFSVQDSDPDLATKFVQQWTSMYIERVDSLNNDLTDRTAQLIDAIYAESKERLADAEKRYEEFQKQWNLTLMETEKTGYETLLSQLETDLEHTEVDIATASTSLSKAREQLTSRERIESLFQAPSADAYWTTKKAAEAGQKVKPIEPGDGLRTEVYNPEYTEVASAEIKADLDLSQASAKKDELTARIDAVRKRIQKLQEDLATQKLVDTALQREVKTHDDSYQLAAKSKDMSEFASANRESDLLLFGDTAAPALPTSMPKSARFVLGFVLGAFLGVAFVLGRHAIRQVTITEAKN